MFSFNLPHFRWNMPCFLYKFHARLLRFTSSLATLRPFRNVVWRFTHLLLLAQFNIGIVPNHNSLLYRELAYTVGKMKIQLIFLSFIVLTSLQWLPADGQKKTGSVSFQSCCAFIKNVKSRWRTFFIYLSLASDVVNQRQVLDWHVMCRIVCLEWIFIENAHCFCNFSHKAWANVFNYWLIWTWSDLSSSLTYRNSAISSKPLQGTTPLW